MSASLPEHKSRWIPSLTEIVFVSVLAWLFFAGAGAVALLGDGDTGWHVRTGEFILTSRSFPKQDLFSFSRAGQPWFAWEWLSDVIFALLHNTAGLAGVVLLGGVLIAATSALLFHYMIWQGSNLIAAVMLMLVASSASTIHWLARPHLFTYFLFALSIWVLESDRRRPTSWIYLVPVLCMLWTNLHGGFMALIATLGIYLAGSVIETFFAARQDRSWRSAKRYGALLGLSAASTLVNPYTYHLHQHIFQYLRSSFILNHVIEFQPPNFRGEGMRYFEVLLFAGMAVVPALARRRDITAALLILFWAHASLLSARHVLLYVVVAAPLVAREATALWVSAAEKGVEWLRILREVAEDYGSGQFGKEAAGRGQALGWLSPVFVLVIAGSLFAGRNTERMRAEFPKTQFPVEACHAAEQNLAGRRIFTSDQWGDYLIYRYYPKLKVFIDGRSDFYGPELGNEYLRAMNSNHQWVQIFDRYKFDLALLPVEWPLATTIKSHPEWRVKYDDGKALLLERVSNAAAQTAQADSNATAPAAGRKG